MVARGGVVGGAHCKRVAVV